jgi:hypothetical protein
MVLDPVTGWSLVKTIADATKSLYDVAKSVKDHEIKGKLDSVLDRLRELKQEASSLEDENRNLREQLRFKSDEFEFKSPFWYDRAHPDQPLCAKCFANKKLGHMGEPYKASGQYRRCLVCDNNFQVERDESRSTGFSMALQ